MKKQDLVTVKTELLITIAIILILMKTFTIHVGVRFNASVTQSWRRPSYSSPSQLFSFLQMFNESQVGNCKENRFRELHSWRGRQNLFFWLNVHMAIPWHNINQNKIIQRASQNTHELGPLSVTAGCESYT